MLVTDQEAAVALLRDELRPGDVVLVKGSRYRTWDVADALRARGGREVRAVFVAAFVAFLISLFGTPIAIRYFTRLKADQPIRADGPQAHLGKKGTPTMGGVVFIFATLIAYTGGHIALTTLPDQQLRPSGPTATARGAAGPVRLHRPARLPRRLPQGRQAQQPRAEQARQAHRPGADRCRLRLDRAVRAAEKTGDAA